jgi:hypothetical protein
VPSERRWRPFYGFMAVSYTTTRTVGSCLDLDLGGSGSSYVLYVAQSEDDARQYGGYGSDSKKVDDNEHILLWKGASQPGLVLRYLHYFNASDGLSPAEVEEANAERYNLSCLDGTRKKLEEVREIIPGIAKIEYF